MRVAAIDIGTNTARLFVASVADGELVEEHRLTDVCGLGRGVDESGRLNADAIGRTVAVLETYRGYLDDVDRVRVVATSASRDAQNRDEFFDAAEAAVGHRPELISGEEEAGLSFAGATSGRSTGAPFLVVDVGGGSTEFVFGTERPEYAVSVDMGSVRLTDRLLRGRPVPEATIAAARAKVRAVLDNVQLPGRAGSVIGVAGTFTSLVAMALRLERYDRALVHNRRLALPDVSTLVADLATRSLEGTAMIPSLDPKRAPVILGGAIVVEQAMDHLNIFEVIVSEHDLLDGVAQALLPE